MMCTAIILLSCTCTPQVKEQVFFDIIYWITMYVCNTFSSMSLTHSLADQEEENVLQAYYATGNKNIM